MNTMYTGTYTPPTLTVDAVVFQVIDGQLMVLLIQRATEPFRGQWALPGVYNAVSETTHDALERALEQKAGIAQDQIALTEQLYTFDTVARDPRGHAVSVSYLCLGQGVVERADGRTQHPTWFAVDKLPALAFDHAEIIRYARRRLTSKMTYTNIIAALMPPTFTLSELQTAHEAVLGRPLDKRNFRKKFLGLGFIEETGAMSSGGAHRPAKLYRFQSRTLQEIGGLY
jgi:8-oxo-dGTP diphosphatase